MTATVITAFTEEQTAALTGLSVARLRNWARTDFFRPAFAAVPPYARLYSFKDLLSLQILKALRIDMGCSLQHLREVKEKLTHLGEDHWSRTTLHVLNKKVVFFDESAGELREPVSGQVVLQIPLKVVRSNMRSAVEKLQRREKSELGVFERRRSVNHNAEVFAGTRIPVAAVKRLHEDGYTVERILQEYPSLTTKDVKAALSRLAKTAA